MVSKAFRECLEDVYHGEQAGEVAFEAMLQTAENSEQRYILGSFMQLETEGKALIRPLLMKFGLPLLDDPDSRASGSAGAGELSQLPWADRFMALAQMVSSTYLPRYEELATLVSVDEDVDAYKLATFMGDHERALIAAANNIAANKADPMAPVTALLKFPLLRPL